MCVRVMEVQHIPRKWKHYFVRLLDLKELNPHVPNASSNYFDDSNLYNFWGKQGAVQLCMLNPGAWKKKQKETSSGLIVLTLLYERKSPRITVFSPVISDMHFTHFKTKGFELGTWNPKSDLP